MRSEPVATTNTHAEAVVNAFLNNAEPQVGQKRTRDDGAEDPDHEERKAHAIGE